MRSRHGVTLVEVLVTLAIIGVLAAILLPAINKAREAARRTQCQSNLRQQLIAIQSLHAAEGALPSLYNGTRLKYPLKEWDLFHMHSWRVPLLPFVEQSALREQIDWQALPSEPENETVAQTAVPTFLCPSGGNPSKMGCGLKHHLAGMPVDEIQAEHKYFVVRSDFDAMGGIAVLPDPFPPQADPSSVDFVRWGIWGWPVFETKTTTGSKLLRYRRGKFRDVRDGLSKTIALVERAGKPVWKIKNKPDGPNLEQHHNNTQYPGQVGWMASNTFIWSINGSKVGVNENNAEGIYSFHPGGANVALADGSVKFLPDSTDFETLVRLYGRSDGGLPASEPNAAE